MNTPEPAPAATPWGVHLKLLGMTALWGASYPWAKTITGAMPILTAATLRFLLAALVLLYWLHHLRRLRSLLTLSRRQWGAMALAALFGITVYTASFMYGVQRMPAGKAAVPSMASANGNSISAPRSRVQTVVISASMPPRTRRPMRV